MLRAIQTATQPDGRILSNGAISLVHGMSRLLIVIFIIGSQLMLVSCASHRVALTPLTETERQELGTIGIAAEVSRVDTWYARDTSIIDGGLKALQDRLSDAG